MLNWDLTIVAAIALANLAGLVYAIWWMQQTYQSTAVHARAGRQEADQAYKDMKRLTDDALRGIYQEMHWVAKVALGGGYSYDDTQKRPKAPQVPVVRVDKGLKPVSPRDSWVTDVGPTVATPVVGGDASPRPVAANGGSSATRMPPERRTGGHSVCGSLRRTAERHRSLVLMRRISRRANFTIQSAERAPSHDAGGYHRIRRQHPPSVRIRPGHPAMNHQCGIARIG